VAAPAVVSRLLGDRADPLLAAADAWMTANSAVIMAVVLVVLGAVLIGNGVAAL
jgi:hypothetical protein